MLHHAWPDLTTCSDSYTPPSKIRCEIPPDFALNSRIFSVWQDFRAHAPKWNLTSKRREDQRNGVPHAPSGVEWFKNTDS
ncbi:hypothetical protein U1Q18_023233, partial [Sarracenia purpurea var. burkii]